MKNCHVRMKLFDCFGKVGEKMISRSLFHLMVVALICRSLKCVRFVTVIGIPEWIAENARSYEQPRNRFNSAAHLDLHEFLTNNGASRFVGGLSLAANLIGKPGKLDVAGHMVQDLWDGGRAREIHDYCRSDVLDTYFVYSEKPCGCWSDFSGG